MSDEIVIPLCPRCGDPVIFGCYPADGICRTDNDPDEADAA